MQLDGSEVQTKLYFQPGIGVREDYVELSAADTVAGLPFLVEVDKQNYVAITEACIDDYPGFYIGKGNSAQDWLPDFLHCPERRKME